MGALKKVFFRLILVSLMSFGHVSATDVWAESVSIPPCQAGKIGNAQSFVPFAVIEGQACSVKLPKQTITVLRKTLAKDRKATFFTNGSNGSKIDVIEASIAQKLSRDLGLKIDPTQSDSNAGVSFTGTLNSKIQRFVLLNDGRFVQVSSDQNKKKGETFTDLGRFKPELVGYLGGTEELPFSIRLSKDSSKIIAESQLPNNPDAKQFVVSIEASDGSQSFMGFINQVGGTTDSQVNVPEILGINTSAAQAAYNACPNGCPSGKSCCNGRGGGRCYDPRTEMCCRSPSGITADVCQRKMGGNGAPMMCGCVVDPNKGAHCVFACRTDQVTCNSAGSDCRKYCCDKPKRCGSDAEQKSGNYCPSIGGS